MAWHDNKWNGKVCCDPASNTYCTGVHSLLSGRIEKRKNTAYEQSDGVRGEYVAKNFTPGNVPPCYWSINAFGDQDIPVEHQHAFDSIEQRIPETLRKYSVITWPFKLSFVHGKESKALHGNYWPDLDQRIDNYIQKFIPKQSVLFFYANYDNPVSGDDMKYLILGCSLVSELPVPQHYDLSDEEVADWRAPGKKFKDGKWQDDETMKNFPTMNWMLQFSHDPESALLLPYHEYLAYTDAHPDAASLLEDIKVVADEESLVKGFKYVSMDIDDDKCLYLLYKIRKAILKVQDHNQVVVKTDYKAEQEKIEKLIRGVWEKRGIYPALPHVLNYLIEDKKKADELAKVIQFNATNDNDLQKILDSIFAEDFPGYLMPFEDTLLDLAESQQFKKYHKSFSKLSLFILTEHQVNKIIKDKPLLKTIEENPYILYEEYEPDEDNLDIPDMQDEPIDVFKVDMGMIPDSNFMTRHRKMQRLKEDSPQRLRSVIINYLWQISSQGHCYSSAKETLDNLYEYPLIYKSGIKLDDEAILSLDDYYKAHFLEKLYIEESKKEKYIYLKIIKQAEAYVEETITTFMNRKTAYRGNIDIAKHIKSSLGKLAEIVKTTEQVEIFTKERKQLYQNVFEKALFVLTGKPGAGKTYETSKVIEHLNSLGEEVVILAPTGKAALRLTENIKAHTTLEGIEAKTIDSYIYHKGFGYLNDNWDAAFELDDEDKIRIDNLVIDESSMLDLNKLSILFSIICINEQYPKRVILVGDENQLPPIGMGKPFHDMITYLKSHDQLAAQYYIHLTSNCRQENDENILELAEAFTEKTRCYEQAFNLIDNGEGKKSKGLYVYKWPNEEVLYQKVLTALEEVFTLEIPAPIPQDHFPKLNLLFKLYDSGYVNNQNLKWRDVLQLESFQVLTPYRTDYFGTVGINRLIQGQYRYVDTRGKEEDIFRQSEKIIRLNNWYWGYGANRRLALSNGSMGVVNYKYKKTKNWWKQEKQYFFRDADRILNSIDDQENFDLGYAITVHKSQGSDFRNVFMIIPKKTALLNKELLYTALTRSKFRLFIFIQETGENLLMKAKQTSALLPRRTSIFRKPELKVGKFSPEPGVTVSSKIELIIYQALQKSGLNFKYEFPLEIPGLPYKIHPDFTIYLQNGKIIYWEHLGMLDLRKYWNDWQERKGQFIGDNKFDDLVTTDDLEGVDMKKLNGVIDDIKHLNLKKTSGNRFSDHHYELN
jgi:ATP-dependent exoDNAse (exonuclease V) alpha subunit